MPPTGRKPVHWAAEDFFTRYAHCVKIGRKNECWLWTGSHTMQNYGMCAKPKRKLLAHRCAYESVHGEGSADGHFIRHKCDNPPCVNPNHLVAGTQTDNMRDASERGRIRVQHGEDNKNAKLTDAKVLRMRALARGGMHISAIASKFKVSRTVTWMAVFGQAWVHLPKSTVPTPQGAMRGEHHTKSKLTEAAIKEIRSSKTSARELAVRFGVSRDAIYDVRSGRVWKHV